MLNLGTPGGNRTPIVPLRRRMPYPLDHGRLRGISLRLRRPVPIGAMQERSPAPAAACEARLAILWSVRACLVHGEARRWNGQARAAAGVRTTHHSRRREFAWFSCALSERRTWRLLGANSPGSRLNES
jgi:hypothetical protein